MNIEPSSVQLICRQIEEEFRFSGNHDVLAIGAVGETLRASTLMLSQRENFKPGPTSVQQSIKWTHRRLQPLFPDVLSGHEVVAEQLDRLNAIGELIKLNSSYILAGPKRRIWIDSTWSLLLGGGSLETLPSELRGNAEVAGLSRITRNIPGCFSNNSFPLQRLEDWLQLEADDMVAWAARFIKQKLAGQGAALDVPDGLNVLYRNRWTPLEIFSGTGDIYLARRKILIYGNPSTEYSVLSLRMAGDSKVIDGLAVITKTEARILQGTIRTGECASERIYYSDDGYRAITIDFHHPLPPGQQKLLFLGWEASRGEDSMPGTSQVQFNKKLTPLLARALSLMGYTLSDKQGGLV